MRLRTIVRSFLLLLSLWITTDVARGQPESVPSVILGGIGNVASSATNFLASAVERPRNLLINATRVTTGLIDSAASKGLEFKLRKVIEKFRSRMPYGIPELDLPPLEPFHLDGIIIDTDNPEIGNVSVTITDLTIYRLSTFVIERAKLSLVGPTIAVDLSFPEIDATGNYNVSGLLGDTFELVGSGPFKATIYDFNIQVSVVLGFYRGLYIRDFDLDFGLRTVSLDVDNFMGDEQIGKLANQVFQELTPKIVEIIKPDILPGIKSYVASRANETLQHLTTRDLLNILLGENEIRDVAHLLIP